MAAKGNNCDPWIRYVISCWLNVENFTAMRGRVLQAGHYSILVCQHRLYMIVKIRERGANHRNVFPESAAAARCHSDRATKAKIRGEQLGMRSNFHWFHNSS